MSLGGRSWGDQLGYCPCEGGQSGCCPYRGNQGIVSEIMDILENISLGPYYINVALLLRNSLLVNGMLFNTDVWYNLSSKDIKELSNVDRHLLCRILKTPTSTPQESLYLELGIEEFDVILSKRRLLYFHDVITRS